MTSNSRSPEEQLEVANWAEQRGMENLREHMAAMDDLKKDSNTALTILMTAGGASLAYAINHLVDTAVPNVVAGAAVLSLYLLGLAGVLLHKCLRVRDAPTVANEPLKLYQPKFSIGELKAEEIKNIDKRIKDARSRNAETSRWLNAIRYAALASPAIFFIIYEISRWCRSS